MKGHETRGDDVLPAREHASLAREKNQSGVVVMITLTFVALACLYASLPSRVVAGQVGVDGKKQPPPANRAAKEPAARKKQVNKNAASNTGRSRQTKSKPVPLEGTVTFYTDQACRITLGSHDVGRLDELQHVEITMRTGEYLVIAKSLDNLHTWKQSIRIDKSTNLTVLIQLKEKPREPSTAAKADEPKRPVAAPSEDAKSGKKAADDLKVEPKPDPPVLSADDHLKTGDRLMTETRWAEAESAYRNGILIKPESTLLRAGLAAALMAQKKYAQAEIEYRRIVAQEPAKPLWHFKLGLALAEQQKYEDAELELTSAVDRDPSNVQFKGTLRQIRQKISLKPGAEAGSLRGVVADQKKAAIQGADIRAKSRTTGIETITQSDRNGQYVFPKLAPGDYTVTVNKTGFKTTVFEGLTVHIGQTTLLDCYLSEGSGRVAVKVR